MDKEKFKVLPYDFIKENQIIASQTSNGFEVISPNKITPALYHELFKYLKKDFTLNICSNDTFNELLTNAFTIDEASSDISEELTDEFDLQSLSLIHI